MMKYKLTISVILIALLFENCSMSIHLNGKYTSGFAGIIGEEISFTEKPDSFEYYLRSENGLLNYSIGSWIQYKKQIFLNGFTDSDIKLLQVESKIDDNTNESKNKILVRYKYDPLSPFLRVDVWLNDGFKVPISGDTTLLVESKIKTIQVKSYLSYNGLLPSTAPIIDTLLSQKIETGDQNSGGKIVSMNIFVNYKDFFRTKLIDTLLIKNGHTFLKGNRILRKVK